MIYHNSLKRLKAPSFRYFDKSEYSTDTLNFTSESAGLKYLKHRGFLGTTSANNCMKFIDKDDMFSFFEAQPSEPLTVLQAVIFVPATIEAISRLITRLFSKIWGIFSQLFLSQPSTIAVFQSPAHQLIPGYSSPAEDLHNTNFFLPITGSSLDSCHSSEISSK